MKKHGLSHIQKWLSIYLCVVILFTIILFLIVYLEVMGTMMALDVVEDAGAFAGLRLRLVLILSGGVVACAVLGYIWMRLAVRQIGRPVHTISRAMSKLAKGQLNETVAIETSDEFERIGGSINELAANLQELLLHIWKQTGHCLSLLENIQSNYDLQHGKQLTQKDLGNLKQLYEAIEGLREMAKAYVFYDVNIEGTKTIAVNRPGEANLASSLEEPSKDLN